MSLGVSVIHLKKKDPELTNDTLTLGASDFVDTFNG